MNRAHGFTLIELMIVVAIIAILSAIAYPAYTKYVYRSRRSDAYAALNQDQAIMERCYAQYFSYAPTTGSCPTIAANSPEGYYSMTVAPTSSTYTITATAIGPQAADTGCATLSLDQAGNKTSTPTGGSANCWGS
ncbi:type-IV pilin [mine drainage metagenome]|uniref:Type-IV pilin n=2 Tax=mine drainage metagenome TaxID=410659 RepID=T1CPH9_9ZZZZ